MHWEQAEAWTLNSELQTFFYRRTPVRITRIFLVVSLIAASMPVPLSAFTRQQLEVAGQDDTRKPPDKSAQEATKPKEEPRKRAQKTA
jgi:hypothetical protein